MTDKSNHKRKLNDFDEVSDLEPSQPPQKLLCLDDGPSSPREGLSQLPLVENALPQTLGVKPGLAHTDTSASMESPPQSPVHDLATALKELPLTERQTPSHHSTKGSSTVTPTTPMNTPQQAKKLMNPLAVAQHWVTLPSPASPDDMPPSPATSVVSSKPYTFWKPIVWVLIIPLAFLVSVLLAKSTQSFLSGRSTLLLDWKVHQVSPIKLFFGRRSRQQSQQYPHIIEPSPGQPRSNLTLRDFLLHQDGVYLAMAPSFFGFYGYFGALSAIDDALSSDTTSDVSFLQSNQIKAVAGGSAGAMAAVLIATGVAPAKAAAFSATMTLDKFADPPGICAAFRGNKFEDLMSTFMKQEQPDSSLLLEDGILPVAVSGFDIRTLRTRILSKGDMAQAARASATFPLLFQPAVWENDDGDESSTTSWLIDGGVEDELGLMGLAAFDAEHPKRILNVLVGGFGSAGPPGPSQMPDGVVASSVLSVSIESTPQCGPHAMSNGPLATEAARMAMLASLDVPLYLGSEPGHYELFIDTTDFIPPTD